MLHALNLILGGLTLCVEFVMLSDVLPAEQTVVVVATTVAETDGKIFALTMSFVANRE